MILQDIQRRGAELGACALLSQMSSQAQLCRALFTPEGLEFCQTHSFPELELLRALDRSVVTEAGIYIDAGEIELMPQRSIAIIGDTRALVHLDGHHCREAIQIVVMHGAQLTLRAHHYAVGRVSTIGQGCSSMIWQDSEACIFEDRQP